MIFDVRQWKTIIAGLISKLPISLSTYFSQYLMPRFVCTANANCRLNELNSCGGDDKKGMCLSLLCTTSLTIWFVPGEFFLHREGDDEDEKEWRTLTEKES